MRLPPIYNVREFVEAGGLMTYGPNLLDLYELRTTTASQKTKGQRRPAPLSPRLNAVYFLAFFAFFFFTIVSSFCSDLGKSEIWLEPINGPNPFNSKSRDLFHTMVNKIEVLS